ncbi:restriction endonuclease [Methylobacter sp. BlB1]|uniref:restriction endonuclease n=1 Tax=Methylobacter sp. BlB1 TaxID=2785914 RepID=UPI00189422AF|nr:restriction endonuclease [Methylobacter sp. BlB1]MBF6649977.1 restriction endonuclease [Methylobacter sp. BlB1]
MEKLTENRCYLIRTKRHFVDRGLVAIGWSNIDFTQYSNSKEIVEAISNKYMIGRRANQIRRFVNMKQGDTIVIPLSMAVAIGSVKDDNLIYSPEDKAKDRANQRRINFFKNSNGELALIPRKSFATAFQSRLRAPGIIVNDISEFKGQLDKIINDLESSKSFSWSNRARQEIEKLEEEFKSMLLKNIRNGKTNLQAGGIGLEHLVKELLKVEGYEADVLSKRAFSSFADADVKASKSDRFTQTNLLIQVKHHQGTTGHWGIWQLKEIKNQSKIDYSDHQLVLVTSASVSEKLREDANELDITVIDGKGLVDWIFDCLEELPEMTKIKLGICEVPRTIEYL